MSKCICIIDVNWRRILPLNKRLIPKYSYKILRFLAGWLGGWLFCFGLVWIFVRIAAQSTGWEEATKNTHTFKNLKPIYKERLPRQRGLASYCSGNAGKSEKMP